MTKDKSFKESLTRLYNTQTKRAYELLDSLDGVHNFDDDVYDLLEQLDSYKLAEKYWKMVDETDGTNHLITKS
jgi:hypothetical protein